MTFISVQNPVKRVGPALIAGFALFLTGAASISGLHLFGSRFGFEFFPLLVLIIWPRRANLFLSFVIVFLAGLFTDWATGDVTGQWALIFVVVWGYLRPEFRSTPFAPVSLILFWFLTCGLAALILSITGYFVYGIAPDLAPIGRQIILATVMLPILMLVRRVIEVRLNEYDDWGR